MRKNYNSEQMRAIKNEDLDHEIAGLRMILKSEPNEKIDSEQFYELADYLRLENIAVLSYYGFESESLLEYPIGKKCNYLACIISGHYHIITNPTEVLEMLKSWNA
jgi:predicted house-cleaning noncanonical NTP pyrophosphatase (MazG superfamily)